MSFGTKILECREQKKINRQQLAKIAGISGTIIGKYEKNERTPSVEIAKKIAVALNISLDYLTGITDMKLDGDIINRIQDIQALDSETKYILFNIIDTYIRDYKTRKIY